MSIYTRVGDQGLTSLFRGQRRLKSDIQIDACGSLDELSSFLGMVILQINKNQRLFFTAIQKDLYRIMSTLSGAKVNLNPLKHQIRLFEVKIDHIEKTLTPLNQFILPQGNEQSCWLHITRTICRRAERVVIRYFSSCQIINQPNNKLIIRYLNRLSDLLYVVARATNNKKELSI